MLFRRKNAFQDEEEPQNVLDELLEKEELSIEEGCYSKDNSAN